MQVTFLFLFPQCQDSDCLFCLFVFLSGKTTEWFTCMGGAARCLMSDVHWGSAVGTVAGPPAQGGIKILGGVPLFQEQIVEVVLTVAVCWVDWWDSTVWFVGSTVGKHMSCSRSSMLVFVRVYCAYILVLRCHFGTKDLSGNFLSRCVKPDKNTVMGWR